MRCKNGELAMFIGNGDKAMFPPACSNLGKIVRVSDFKFVFTFQHPDGSKRTTGDVWKVTPPLQGTTPSGRIVDTNYCPDAWLKPLGNPGEEEKDEMLRPLPRSKSKSDESAQ